MRLRTFTAPDMPSAMKMVREALGDDAIILSTESHKGKKSISVTAAVDPGEASSSGEHSESRGSTSPFNALKNRSPDVTHAPPRITNNLSFEIQNVLRFHNIPEHFVSKILHKASSKEFVSLSALHHISANHDEKPLVRLLLEKLLNSFFQYTPLSFDDNPLRIMLVGPPGIGKTLTIAKIATKLAMEKQTIAVFTADNQRAGGVEQLQAFTDILETPLQCVASAEELSHELKSVYDHTHVLIDTAGCNPYDAKELKELKKLTKQKNIEPIMVLPAGGDSAETIDIVEAFADTGIKRLIITRADTARRFGGIVAAAAAHKLALANISNSSSIANPLDPMNGGKLAQMLLKYQ